MRVIARFSKDGDLRFISHLDMVHAIERAMRRADIPVVYSEGFSPHMKIAFSAPTPLGISTSAEYMDVHIDGEFSPFSFMERLNEMLPTKMRVLEAVQVEDNAPRILGKAAIGSYTIELKNKSYYNLLCEALNKLEKLDEIVMGKKSKSGPKAINIKPCIKKLAVLPEAILRVNLLLPSAGGINPSVLLEAVCVFSNGKLNEDMFVVHKDDVLLENGERLV